MSNHSNLMIADVQVKAGEAAIKYCIEHNLAAYYIVGKEKVRTGIARYVESGPYITLESALQAKPNDDMFSIQLLSEAEAHALRI